MGESSLSSLLSSSSSPALPFWCFAATALVCSASSLLLLPRGLALIASGRWVKTTQFGWERCDGGGVMDDYSLRKRDGVCE